MTKRITFLFYRAKWYKGQALKKKVLSCSISLWTGMMPWNWGSGPYSHAEILFEERQECFSSASWGGKNGVRLAPASEILVHPERWDFVSCLISDDSEQRMYEEAKKLCGKPYDYIGVAVSFIQPLNIQDKAKWYCSEVVAFIAYIGNLFGKLFRRISPRRLSLICANTFGRLRRYKNE